MKTSPWNKSRIIGQKRPLQISHILGIRIPDGSQQCDGMLIGNAEIVPFRPQRYLYHAYMAYMRANGLSKPVSLTRFGTDMHGAMAKYGKAYLRRKSTKGHMRSNLTLSQEAEAWLPFAGGEEK